MLSILDFLKEYSSLIATSITGFTGFVAWWLAKNFARKEDLEKLETKIDDDLEVLEKKVDNLASSKDVKALNTSLNEMQKTIAVFTEKFDHIDKDNKRLTTVIDRIDSYLRGHK